MPVVEWTEGEPLEVALEEVTAFRRSQGPRSACAAGALAAYGGAVVDALARAPSPVLAFVPRRRARSGAARRRALLPQAAASALRSSSPAQRMSPPLPPPEPAPTGAPRSWPCCSSSAASWRRGRSTSASRIRPEPEVAWRRGMAVAALALAGLAVATLVVALSAVPPSHGLGWTVLGAAAAVGRRAPRSGSRAVRARQA